MATLVVMALLVAVYAAASYYLQKANQYLALTDAPWNRMYVAAKQVISDEEMPQRAAAFAAGAVLCAGCGCLTRAILFDAFTLRRARKPSRPQDKLTAQQEHVFSQVVMNAIYYDSLKAPLSGFLLRRLVMPSLRELSENRMPDPPKAQVADIVESSTKAIKHSTEGKRVLALATCGVG